MRNSPATKSLREVNEIAVGEILSVEAGSRRWIRRRHFGSEFGFFSARAFWGPMSTTNIMSLQS